MYALPPAGKVSRILALSDNSSSTLPDMAVIFGNGSNCSPAWHKIAPYGNNEDSSLSDGKTAKPEFSPVKQERESSSDSSTTSVHGSPRPRVTPSVRHFGVFDSDASQIADTEEECETKKPVKKLKKGWVTKNGSTKKNKTRAIAVVAPKSKTGDVSGKGGAKTKESQTQKHTLETTGPHGKGPNQKEKPKVTKTEPEMVGETASKRRRTAGHPPKRFIMEDWGLVVAYKGLQCWTYALC